MKKMLVKAVALSLVMGGVGFVANNAQAADISDGVKVYSGLNVGFGHDVKTEKVLEKDTALANQKDLVKVNEEVAINKANIAKNAGLISDNAVAIDKEIAAREGAISEVKDDIAANADAIKANSDAIKANADAIAANKADADEQHKYLNSRIEHNTACIDNNKVAIENETAARIDADNKLGEAIKTKADAWDTAKKFAKVQEMFDNQDSKNAELDKKNGEQDAAIEANGQAIAANKDAIKANADAIAANKADADEQHKYLNSRIEHNTACIDKNKVAIENETQARVDADKKLDQKITDEAKAREDADKAEAKAREDADKAEAKAREDADKAEAAAREAADKAEAAAREAADKVLDGKIADEAKTRADEDARIEAKFDGEVSRLDGRINQLDARVEKVGAMAAAIANLHTMGYDPEAPTEIAVGVGQYRDKTGMALGAFHYPNRDFMLSFSVSTAGDEFMGGIGATWKFGRKSPEELRQAEAEKAAKAKLAKAEAAKKAAKDARVAAQQKRHAEMLAARTGK